MHLGAVVLLFRRQLVATTEAHLQDSGEWPKDLSVADANKCRDECAAAGQQVARILRLLSFDGTLTTRCWLIMYVILTTESPTRSQILNLLQLLGVYSGSRSAFLCFHQIAQRPLRDCGR